MIGWLKKRLRDGINEWRDPQSEEVPMPCPEITIEGIDLDLYTKLMESAVAGGAQFSGNLATIDGLSFDWKYDSVAQVLHIICLKKPFYFSCGIVETKIRELIEKSKGEI